MRKSRQASESDDDFRDDEELCEKSKKVGGDLLSTPTLFIHVQ